MPPRDWENWAEVPLQRERLLGLAQRTMNRGSSKVAGADFVRTGHDDRFP